MFVRQSDPATTLLFPNNISVWAQVVAVVVKSVVQVGAIVEVDSLDLFIQLLKVMLKPMKLCLTPGASVVALFKDDTFRHWLEGPHSINRLEQILNPGKPPAP